MNGPCRLHEYYLPTVTNCPRMCAGACETTWISSWIVRMPAVAKMAWILFSWSYPGFAVVSRFALFSFYTKLWVPGRNRKDQTNDLRQF